MTTYRIGSILVHPGQENIGEILEAAYKSRVAPLCMCKGEPGIPMHIAHINDSYWIRRNPRTGLQHEMGCGSWEMPDDLSGRADISGTGISNDGDKTFLRLDFPLAKQGNREAPPTKLGGNEDRLSVTNGGKRLSIQGLLHALWDEAGLSKWEGGGPRRSWGYVQKNLLAAIEDKVVKQHPLSHFMFIPEAWTRQNAAELETARRKRFIEFAVQQDKKGHQLMLLIGEMKKIEPSSAGGFHFVVWHVPGFSFSGNDILKDRIDKHYSKESIIVSATTEMGSHQIVAATFSVRPEGTAEIEEICYMPVNNQWIPFDNIYEHEMIQGLIATGRSFLKPLRYNRRKTAVMPSAVLTDTENGPTAMYIIMPDQDSDQVQSAGLEVNYGKWYWDTKEGDRMPMLPEKLEATAGELQYLQRMNSQGVPNATLPVHRPKPVPQGAPAHPFIRPSVQTASEKGFKEAGNISTVTRMQRPIQDGSPNESHDPVRTDAPHHNEYRQEESLSQQAQTNRGVSEPHIVAPSSESDKSGEATEKTEIQDVSAHVAPDAEKSVQISKAVEVARPSEGPTNHNSMKPIPAIDTTPKLLKKGKPPVLPIAGQELPPEARAVSFGPSARIMRSSAQATENQRR
jgi:hypothetical protein